MALAGEISSAKMEPRKPINQKTEILRFQKKTGSYMEVRFNGPCGKFKLTNMADDQVDLRLQGTFLMLVSVKKR